MDRFLVKHLGPEQIAHLTPGIGPADRGHPAVALELHRQAQKLVVAEILHLFQDVAGEVVLVQPLHDYDRFRTPGLTAGRKGAVEPVQRHLPLSIRFRLLGVVRIVHDFAVRVLTRRPAAGRGGHPPSAIDQRVLGLLILTRLDADVGPIGLEPLREQDVAGF